MRQSAKEDLKEYLDLLIKYSRYIDYTGTLTKKEKKKYLSIVKKVRKDLDTYNE